MTNFKRKRDELEQARRQRRRKRSHSEPLLSDTDSSEKRQALKRLFGRMCSVDQHHPPAHPPPEEHSDYEEHEPDENEDPLLDDVPEDMDPEQLGFLVCAQETLRFLYRRGVAPDHPMFSRLRRRLLQGIDEIAMA